MTEDKISLVDQAARAAERLEAATREYNRVVDRQEALAARMTLGGKSDAGIPPPEKKEETPQEYKNRVMKGGFKLEKV